VRLTRPDRGESVSGIGKDATLGGGVGRTPVGKGSMSRHSKRGRMSWALVVGVAGAFALAAIAWAAPVTIPGPDQFQQTLRLNSAGDAFFDVYQPPDQYNDDCALGDLGGDIEDDVGFSPASDGESDDGSNDEFDGGLILSIQGAIFEDTDHVGDKVGEQITVGPTKLKGLRVKRVETALQGSPTLRSLIKLKNKSKQNAKKRTVTWESDLGADTNEVVRATSSGDSALTDSDRWLVFADDDATPGDAVGTLVLYGKGKGVKKTRVENPVADQDGCVRHTIRVKVPKKSSHYLLFFTEVHNADEDGVDQAESDAAKFNKKKPGGSVLGGLKKSVKKKILNWDLTKK
jgi:hypothetical protein